MYKNLSNNYNPVAFLEDDLADGYVMLDFMGTGRQYHIGAGNANESFFGVPDKTVFKGAAGEDNSSRKGIGTKK